MWIYYWTGIRRWGSFNKISFHDLFGDWQSLFAQFPIISNRLKDKLFLMQMALKCQLRKYLNRWDFSHEEEEEDPLCQKDGHFPHFVLQHFGCLV